MLVPITSTCGSHLFALLPCPASTQLSLAYRIPVIESTELVARCSCVRCISWSAAFLGHSGISSKHTSKQLPTFPNDQQTSVSFFNSVRILPFQSVPYLTASSRERNTGSSSISLERVRSDRHSFISDTSATIDARVFWHRIDKDSRLEVGGAATSPQFSSE